MTRQRTRTSRAGFTLIELLMVILIISVLVALLVVGVAKALSRGKEVQAKVEISQLSTALVNFQASFQVQFVPSQIILDPTGSYGGASPTTLQANSKKYVSRLWPRLNFSAPTVDFSTALINFPAGTVVTLQGDQCLTYFLSGIPTNPNIAGSQTKPLFEFQSKRFIVAPSQVVANPNGFNPPSYMDPYGDPTNSSNTPNNFYAFYSVGMTGSYEIDCTNLVSANFAGYADDSLNPNSNYVTNLATPALKAATDPKTFFNKSSFQIISPGKDGDFGVSGGAPVYSVNQSNGIPSSKPAADNITNFGTGSLGAAN